MRPSGDKKKGIEISRWKVGEADDFLWLEPCEDYGIEQEHLEDCGGNVSEQSN